ncbi:MAG: hypothetical protein C5B47_04930 [Verrucomicrobia bacterium]|nr:MAG: hypothetical protein C5B47_04930 [Verrucomicrobiota bacterium]
MGGTLSGASLSFETNLGGILPQLFAANVVLVVFNLIPAFPMDGGRVLRAALALCTNRTRATVIAARIGQAIALLFIAAGVATWVWPTKIFGEKNIILPFIGLFIFLVAQQEMAYAVFKQTAETIRVGHIMAPRFLALPFDLSVGAAVGEISREPLAEYPLVDKQFRFRGMVSRREILKMSEAFPDRPLLELALQSPVISSEHTCSEAVETMRRYGVSVLPVANPDGQVVGLVGIAQLVNEASYLASQSKKPQ